MMEDYKRLTDKEHKYKGCVDCTYRNCQYCDDIVDYEKEAYNRLCDLEDKIANGTLVELPCKVGTKVYFIIDYPAYFKPIEETTVNGVTQFIEDGIIQNQITTSSCLCFDYERDLGRTLFLTKAEAEAKLRELKEKENENS